MTEHKFDDLIARIDAGEAGSPDMEQQLAQHLGWKKHEGPTPPYWISPARGA